jgi:hypothetical protein
MHFCEYFVVFITVQLLFFPGFSKIKIITNLFSCSPGGHVLKYQDVGRGHRSVAELSPSMHSLPIALSNSPSTKKKRKHWQGYISTLAP